MGERQSVSQGVLVVDKPMGITSHDVVKRVRVLARTRRVGHTGTLDPLATGVLVLLLGPATRLAQFAAGHRKSYRATVHLGVSTTTYDAEGEITAMGVAPEDESLIRQALERFVGVIQQVPPMYSAVRVDGKRLYRLARAGMELEREPRPVEIRRLEILEWRRPELTLHIECSAGTYIRSLAHDLGQTLGCGAHLSRLIRTSSGPFSLEGSHTLDTLNAWAHEGRFAEALLPSYAILDSMPIAALSEEQERAMRFGQRLRLELEQHAATLVQARDARGELIGVLLSEDDGLYRPTVVLPRAEDAG